MLLFINASQPGRLSALYNKTNLLTTHSCIKDHFNYRIEILDYKNQYFGEIYEFYSSLSARQRQLDPQRIRTRGCWSGMERFRLCECLIVPERHLHFGRNHPAFRDHQRLVGKL